MVQGKTIFVIVVESVYLTISIIASIYAYYYLPLELNDWIALISLLVFVGIFVLNGLSEILKVLSRPKLKIVDGNVKVHNEGSEGEFKDFICIIRNVGGEEARDCKIKVKVKEVWQDFYCLPEVPFDIYPDDKRSKFLSQIIKREGKMFIRGTRKTTKHPPLQMGQVYTLEIRFYGRNFKDKKVHTLRLDLSSWKSIGIKLDC